MLGGQAWRNWKLGGFVVDETLAHVGVGVNTAITKKRPVRPLRIDGVEIDFNDDDFFRVRRRLVKNRS